MVECSIKRFVCHHPLRPIDVLQANVCKASVLNIPDSLQHVYRCFAIIGELGWSILEVCGMLYQFTKFGKVVICALLGSVLRE